MAEGVDTIGRHTLPKKANRRQCQNYRTISLISHPSKSMLRVILNRLKVKAEELLTEEQAGFRPGRIFNTLVITEKHLQHQRDLFHNFIDFEKAFDRLWHAGLWQVLRSLNIGEELVLRSLNIDEGLVQAIQALYENSSGAVILNS